MAGFFTQSSLQKQTTFYALAILCIVYQGITVSTQATISHHAVYQNTANNEKLFDGLCILFDEVESANESNAWNSVYSQVRQEIANLQATFNGLNVSNANISMTSLETFNTAATEWINTMDTIDDMMRINELSNTIPSIFGSEFRCRNNQKRCSWLNNQVFNNCSSALGADQCVVRQNFSEICNARGIEPICGGQMCSAMGYA